jgi:hypothetical protein
MAKESLLGFIDWLHSDDKRLIKLLKNLGHWSLRRLSQIYCKNINQERKGLKNKNIDQEMKELNKESIAEYYSRKKRAVSWKIFYRIYSSWNFGLPDECLDSQTSCSDTIGRKSMFPRMSGQPNRIASERKFQKVFILHHARHKRLDSGHKIFHAYVRTLGQRVRTRITESLLSGTCPDMR